MYKIPVGILGASGLVGKEYLRLLKAHPYFEVVYQSSRSTVKDFERASPCTLLFSALPSEVAKEVEPEYAQRGFPIFSSASYHRLEEDIPLIIPEINAKHFEMIPMQQKRRGWDKGFIVSKPNCTLQSYLLPLYPLHKRFQLERLSVTTLQAISGAGKGFELKENVLPFIFGEEEKSEREPLKILGEWDGHLLRPLDVTISAHCTRVPVLYGHLVCVSAAFKEKPTLDEVLDIWKTFPSLDLPSAPENLLVYLEESDRPQPLLDSERGKGMSVALGRLRTCPLFDIRFTALSHNLIRGAAGGGILTAEVYCEKIKYI